MLRKYLELRRTHRMIDRRRASNSNSQLHQQQQLSLKRPIVVSSSFANQQQLLVRCNREQEEEEETAYEVKGFIILLRSLGRIAKEDINRAIKYRKSFEYKPS